MGVRKASALSTVRNVSHCPAPICWRYTPEQKLSCSRKHKWVGEHNHVISTPKQVCTRSCIHTQVRAHVDSSCSDLVVEDDDIAGVCIEPGVHGLTDTADLLQGWCVQVRPAKFQDL